MAALPDTIETLVNFHPYQRRWLVDDSRFKIGMFARQTGKTFTTCGEIVDDCIKAEIEGKRVRWVILSRGERQAKEAIDEGVTPFVKAFYILYKAALKNKAEPTVQEIEFSGTDNPEAKYKGLEVTFPSGSRITALPANPDTARGYSANVFLDEFAFHKDSRAIWRALFPVISKSGLKLRVTSTPNGKGNKFYELISGSNDGWSRHVVDIYQAVKDGLDRDIDQLRTGIADDDAWAQEYELKFLDEASSWLSYDLISSVEDELAGRPELYQGGPVYIGNDIAARNDLWVAWVLEEVGDVLWTRELIARKGITFAEQDAIMDELALRYRMTRLAMDQTGMGEKPVEDAKKRYGDLRVEGVLFTAGRKLDLATHGKQVMQDRKVRIPAGDPVLRADLHKLKKIDSPTGAPRLIADSDAGGHADRTWALFLACAAGNQPLQPAAGATSESSDKTYTPSGFQRRGLIPRQDNYRRRA